jgi:hypothetical protein
MYSMYMKTGNSYVAWAFVNRSSHTPTYLLLISEIYNMYLQCRECRGIEMKRNGEKEKRVK